MRSRNDEYVKGQARFDVKEHIFSKLVYIDCASQQLKGLTVMPWKEAFSI